MSKVNIAKIARETNRDNKEYVGPKYVSRCGIHYSWFNAGNLDAGIRDRQQFAVD